MKYDLPKTLIDLLDFLNTEVGTARIAGGAVRDILRGETPNDFDIAIAAKPDLVKKILGNIDGIKVIDTGVDHGTLTVLFEKDGSSYEVTSLRRDVSTDGRRASVEFTDSFEEDAKRRDFTMNGLFMDADGRIHDYVGGVDDIKSNEIRFIGDANERIEEDYLRILRYFRFAVRFDQYMYFSDLETIKQHAPEIRKFVSRERIWMELKKILSCPKIYGVMNKMEHCGVLKAIMPEGYRKAFKPLDLCQKPLVRLHYLYLGKPGIGFVNYDMKVNASVLKESFALSNIEAKNLTNVPMMWHVCNGEGETGYRLNNMHIWFIMKRGDVNSVIHYIDVFNTKQRRKTRPSEEEIRDRVNWVLSNPPPVAAEDFIAAGVEKRKLSILLDSAAEHWFARGTRDTKETIMSCAIDSIA